MAWREKNKAMNFVLTHEAVLQNLIDQAWDLLDENHVLRGPFFGDLEDIGHRFTNMFYDINENSFDVCWTTKQKEVLEFENSVIAKISEIRRCVKAEPDTTELYLA